MLIVVTSGSKEHEGCCPGGQFLRRSWSIHLQKFERANIWFWPDSSCPFAVRGGEFSLSSNWPWVAFGTSFRDLPNGRCSVQTTSSPQMSRSRGRQQGHL